MLEQINNLPSTVIGFTAKGQVTKEDYQSVFIPAVEESIGRTNEIRFLLVLETDLKNFTFSAWMNDAWQGIKHYTQWKKVAIVNDQGAVNKFYTLASSFVPGEVRSFQATELDQAKKWVAEE